MILPIRSGVLTASDRSSQGLREDQSGQILKNLLETLPSEVVAYQIVRDDKVLLAKSLCDMCDLLLCNLILTTGGTGLAPSDTTPEATLEVIDKEVPGIAEAIRYEGIRKTPFAMLSRGIAGVRSKTLIVNFPGSPKAVRESFEVLRPVLLHAIELIRGGVQDCQPRLSQLPH